MYLFFVSFKTVAYFYLLYCLNVSLALFCLYKAFGVEPSQSAGHSKTYFYCLNLAIKSFNTLTSKWLLRYTIVRAKPCTFPNNLTACIQCAFCC